MSVDSADNTPKSVSLLDAFRAITIDGFIAIKITIRAE
jgi:hypothetical protein